jgi:hypothetical protein
MGKLIGIILIVVGIWVGMTVYTEGTDQAFGGVFAFFGASSSEEPAADARSTPRRAADAFQRAYDKSLERVDRSLGEEESR